MLLPHPSRCCQQVQYWLLHWSGWRVGLMDKFSVFFQSRLLIQIVGLHVNALSDTSVSVWGKNNSWISLTAAFGMVVNICASKQLSFFLRTWRLLTVHLSYLFLDRLDPIVPDGVGEGDLMTSGQSSGCSV